MKANHNLTDEQKEVLFNKATEAPFSGQYLNNYQAGNYYCANFGNFLFSSETKFDSGSGWPSFYNTATKEAVKLVEDRSANMQRVEVQCAKCGGHLGHVFNDAPETPTNMRFCINSLALDFKKS
ncbi:peptide-methionine (R)-S-oxide reductase MsrB [Candidatus Saccharibacteria bacterium]|nr:peptide-methionine (R)-S-oxide reductase MsrB [Candidatus Saccharibacteria bacterium]